MVKGGKKMNSFLMDLIETCHFEFLQLRETSKYFKNAEETEKQLIKTLNEEQIKLFESIKTDYDWHYDEVYRDYCIEILYFGIKAGMEFQEFLDRKY